MEHQFLISSEIEKQVSFQVISISNITDIENEEIVVVATINIDEKSRTKSVHFIPSQSFNQWNYSDIEYRDLDTSNDGTQKNLPRHSYIYFEILIPSSETYKNPHTSIKLPFYSVKAIGYLPLFRDDDSFFPPILLQGRQKVELFSVQPKEFKFKQNQYYNILGKLENSINWEDKLVHNQLQKTTSPILSLPQLQYLPPISITKNYDGTYAVSNSFGNLVIDLPNFPSVVYLNTPFSFNYKHYQTDFFKDRVSSIQDLSVNNPDDRISISENRPTTKERKEIDKALSTFRLSPEQKELLFQYRKYLTTIPGGRAVVKLLQSVDWSNILQKTKVNMLLAGWSDILPFVGVEMLHVYEDLPIEVRLKSAELINAIETDELINYLLPIVKILPRTHNELVGNESPITIDEEDGSPKKYSLILNLLIKRAREKFIFANNLYWFIAAESSDKIYNIYKNIIQKELSSEFMETIALQEQFRKTLTQVYEKKNLDNADYMKENLLNFQFPKNGLPLPINPEVRVVALEKYIIFKSKTRPLRLTFRTVDGDIYEAMYKYNDDLSLDNYLLQMLRLIDNYLKKEHFDLHLTPYRVLPTSKTDGFIEFVESKTLVKIRSSLHTILKDYFITITKSFEPLIENFIISCAGYVMINYIFGLGDRHENNLMVKPDGNFFHIDFGYLFGKEPPMLTSWVPKMHMDVTFSNIMWNSLVEQEERFINICCEAYRRVRSIAPIICCLTTLMESFKCTDVKYVNSFEGATSFVEKQFRLDLDNTEADDHFRTVIRNCKPSFMTTQFENIYFTQNRG